MSSKFQPALLPSETNLTAAWSSSAKRGNTSPQALPEEAKELVEGWAEHTFMQANLTAVR